LFDQKLQENMGLVTVIPKYSGSLLSLGITLGYDAILGFLFEHFNFSGFSVTFNPSPQYPDA
jgi:hypothetical protein